ncbi:DNA-binding transcriptional ArsR family regulator [Methanolinea mesophila]|uniref:ArsR/SmtB family transcription factor n=1 Tax=Methanolinea mesophila TaxID=547055 RepID=UPI001AE21F76|nr:helix-turn-helix domain-containing protein [Methanolinea mesophila]MBP1929657.1 DNA-binding transcriptional ArsR family regulator [Methanolinea mesophila]
MSEEVIILSPGDSRAQKIAKAISSSTANDILHLLGDGHQTATDITGSLDLPMSTVKYHLENLLDAGLVEVVETKYSIKGREIKVYALRDQLLIVAPKMQNIRSLLLKYASLFAIVALISLAGFFYLPLLGPAVSGPTGGGGGVNDGSFVQEQKSVGIMSAPAPTSEVAQRAFAPPAPSFDPVLAFFLGGCLVILMLAVYEAYLWRKNK